MSKRRKTDKWVKRTCKECGKIFFVPPNQVMHGRGKYCSRTCLSRAGGKALRAKYPLTHNSGKNPHLAKKAYKMISRAIKQGKLKRQPCEICGSTKSVCAHHDDYAKPFDVRWLCQKHHIQYHAGQI